MASISAISCFIPISFRFIASLVFCMLLVIFFLSSVMLSVMGANPSNALNFSRQIFRLTIRGKVLLSLLSRSLSLSSSSIRAAVFREASCFFRYSLSNSTQKLIFTDDCLDSFFFSLNFLANSTMPFLFFWEYISPACSLISSINDCKPTRP